MPFSSAQPSEGSEEIMIRIYGLLLTLCNSQTAFDLLTDAPPKTLGEVERSPRCHIPRRELIETTEQYVLRFCARAGTAGESDTRSGNLDPGIW